MTGSRGVRRSLVGSRSAARAACVGAKSKAATKPLASIRYQKQVLCNLIQGGAAPAPLGWPLAASMPILLDGAVRTATRRWEAAQALRRGVPTAVVQLDQPRRLHASPRIAARSATAARVRLPLIERSPRKPLPSGMGWLTCVRCLFVSLSAGQAFAGAGSDGTNGTPPP